MRYFRINNDLDTVLGANRDLTPEEAQARLFEYWINTEHAYTTANIDEDGQGYKKFGVQALGKLSEGDTVFMYENKRGILAVGQVQENWNGQRYRRGNHEIYQGPNNTFEVYKIKVRWNLCFNDNPIGPQELRGYGITHFRKAVHEISDDVASQIKAARKGSACIDTKNPNDPSKASASPNEEDFEKAVQASLNLPKKARQERLRNAPRKPNQRSVTTTVFERNPDVVAEVLERANGFCENEKCRKPAPFLRASDNTPYLEVHHKIPLAQDGDDTVENAIALCPNCHREAHFG